MHQDYEEQWKKMGRLCQSLALLPQVVHGVQEVCDTIRKNGEERNKGRIREGSIQELSFTVNLQCAFDETEDALLMLEDMIETQELREKQLEQRFQLALYQEKRMSELEDLKGNSSFPSLILGMTLS